MLTYLLKKEGKETKGMKNEIVFSKRYGTERCNLGPVCVSGCAGPLRGPFLATQVSAEKEEKQRK